MEWLLTIQGTSEIHGTVRVFNMVTKKWPEEELLRISKTKDNWRYVLLFALRLRPNTGFYEQLDEML